MKLIQSRDNPFYKSLVKLVDSARWRDKNRQTLLDGVHLLESYLDAGKLPLHILLHPDALDSREISVLLKRVANVPVTQLDSKLFSTLSELKTHTGILTLIELPQAEELMTPCHFALLLEGIQDPGNMGSMLRSAAAAGCEAVFLSAECTDAWSPKVLRAAMGGHFSLRIHERQNLFAVAQAFSGILLATSLQATHSLYDCDLKHDVAFLIGNEGAGLSDELLNVATCQITIPMMGKIESLNAAAAAAVCLFEAARQKQTVSRR